MLSASFEQKSLKTENATWNLKFENELLRRSLVGTNP